MAGLVGGCEDEFAGGTMSLLFHWFQKRGLIHNL